MPLVVVDGGESLALQYLVNKAAPQNLVLCLFKSNTTPAETDVIGTYTEADFPGYSNITLTGASWTVSGTAPTAIGYAQQTFTCTGGGASQSIYGYFYKRLTGGELVIAERFSDAPYPMLNNGDQTKITPNITAD
jgi:hypothetical protein